MPKLVEPTKPIRVRFNDPEEFLDELLKRNRYQLLPCPILRVTTGLRYAAGEVLVNVEVIAGYWCKLQTELTLIELHKECGQVMTGETFEKTAAGQAANKIIDRLREAAQQNQMDFRSGIYV